MICKNCGNANADNVSFCGNCGMPLQQPEIVTESVMQSEPPKKKKRGLKIAIIIVSVLLVVSLLLAGIVVVGLGFALGWFNFDEPKAVVTDDYYVESYDDYEDIYDYGDLSPEEYQDNFVDDSHSEKLDYSNFTGTYYDASFSEYDLENGPCYGVALKSFDSETGDAVFEVYYVGRNVSPYYSTGDINVVVSDNGYASFTWSDTWMNSGSGNIQFVDGNEPCIKLEMTQTETADFNRYSLETDGYKDLTYKY